MPIGGTSRVTITRQRWRASRCSTPAAGPLIHYSTDMFRRPQNPATSRGSSGRVRYGVEVAWLRILTRPRAYILRTGWVYAATAKLSHHSLRLAAEREELRVV